MEGCISSLLWLIKIVTMLPQLEKLNILCKLHIVYIKVQIFVTFSHNYYCVLDCFSLWKLQVVSFSLAIARHSLS